MSGGHGRVWCHSRYSQTCVNDSVPVWNGTACVVSDSGPFAVKSAAVWTLGTTTGVPAAARKAWFGRVALALQRGLDATPMRDDLVSAPSVRTRVLVENDAANPRCDSLCLPRRPCFRRTWCARAHVQLCVCVRVWQR